MNTIRNIVDSAKDPIAPKMYKGVHSIPCSCGKVYIDEMRRSMQVRFKEHSADLRLQRSQKSSLDKHFLKTNHHICLENAKIVSKVDHYGKTKVMDSLKIELNTNNLSRDEGWKLSESWKPLLHTLENY